MHCFSHVLHLSINLSSIASYFITFMHLYGFLVSLDHLYISRVKLCSFFYSLSNMTKRERKCGFFLRFHMLRGEIHAFVKGFVFHLVRRSVYLLIVLGTSFSLLYTGLVTIFTYIVLIFIYIYIYIYDDDDDDDVCLLHLSLHVLFLLYLYMHVSLCTQSLFMFHT